jgi:hypothetical protein
VATTANTLSTELSAVQTVLLLVSVAFPLLAGLLERERATTPADRVLTGAAASPRVREDV